MKQKNIHILFLVLLALLGLALAAWQSGSDTSNGDWQKPIIQASASTPTITDTPGWWEIPAERPVVPTMPGKNNHTTPTPETLHP